MDVTTWMTAQFPVVLLLAALLAAAASAVLLRLYRRATIRGMGENAGVDRALPKRPGTEAAVTVSGKPLRVEVREGGIASLSTAVSEARYSRSAHALRSGATMYALGGMAYALVLTVPWMVEAGGGFFLGRFLWLFVCYSWPIVLAVSLVAMTSRRERIGLAGAYFAVTAVVGAYVLIRSPDATLDQLLYFWLFCNAPGTLLLLAFLNRRVRAVGPLVLTFMVVGVLGAFLAIAVAQFDERVLRAVASVGAALGLGATTLFVLMHVVGFAVFGLLGWYLLRWLGKRYREKRLSDQSLTMDSMWLLFGIVQPITLAFDHWGWFFVGLVGFAGYKLVTLGGFGRLSKRAERDAEPPMLLLLRVFALGRRSERVFDTVSTWWRHMGNISLIAGPDLVTSSVEPHEFLEFVGGRLSRRFVQDEADLDRRFAEIDRYADPDTRYRVTEFFCRADTWQMTMRRLADESASVLMDLRSFSGANQGCLYELEQLLNIVDLRHVGFLVDETTDLSFLEQTLQHLWGRIDSSSPNRDAEAPVACLFHASDQSARSLKGLLLMLMGSTDLAAPPRTASPQV